MGTVKIPKNRKARYHRLTLNTGHILEIGWHFGRQKYVVTVWNPKDYENDDVWEAEKQFFGDTPREVLSGARLEIAEQVNPAIKKVRQQVAPNESVLTAAKLRDAKAMLLGTHYGAPSQKLFVNSKTAQELQSRGLQGLTPNMVIVDELEDGAFVSDTADALKYLIQSADKKNRRW